MLRQMGSHEFDEIRFLTGLEFTRAVAHLTHFDFPGIDVEDTFNLLVELSQKIPGVVSFRATPGQHTWQTVLVGEEGTRRANFPLAHLLSEY